MRSGSGRGGLLLAIVARSRQGGPLLYSRWCGSVSTHSLHARGPASVGHHEFPGRPAVGGDLAVTRSRSPAGTAACADLLRPAWGRRRRCRPVPSGLRTGRPPPPSVSSVPRRVHARLRRPATRRRAGRHRHDLTRGSSRADHRDTRPTPVWSPARCWAARGSHLTSGCVRSPTEPPEARPASSRAERRHPRPPTPRRPRRPRARSWPARTGRAARSSRARIPRGRACVRRRRGPRIPPPGRLVIAVPDGWAPRR